MYCGRQVHTGFCKTGVIRTKPETNPECPLYKRTDFIRKVEIWWIHKHGGTTGLCLSFKMKSRRIKMSPPPTLQIQNFTIKENRQIAKKKHVGPYFWGRVLCNKKKNPEKTSAEFWVKPPAPFTLAVLDSPTLSLREVVK